jgi:hypothetical protein
MESGDKSALLKSADKSAHSKSNRIKLLVEYQSFTEVPGRSLPEAAR